MSVLLVLLIIFCIIIAWFFIGFLGVIIIMYMDSIDAGQKGVVKLSDIDEDVMPLISYGIFVWISLIIFGVPWLFDKITNKCGDFNIGIFISIPVAIICFPFKTLFWFIKIFIRKKES